MFFQSHDLRKKVLYHGVTVWYPHWDWWLNLSRLIEQPEVHGETDPEECLFLGVLRNLPMVTCLKKGPPSNMLSCQLMESHLNGCSLWSWIRLKQKNASNLTCNFIEEPIGCKHVVQHCAFEFSDSIALQLHLLTTCGPAWQFLSYFALPFHTWCWDESGYEIAQPCKICHTG